MLSIQKLSFAHKNPVFDDFSLEINAGDFIHLTGPNGAGKTSLLRLLAGLIPDIYPGNIRGRITFEGKHIPHEAELPGVCLTGPWAASRLFCRNVWEEVSFSPQADAEEARRLLGYFGLTDLIASHPQKLSGGQQQLVLLIAYLCCHPQILLLDECFAQLSAPERKLLSDLLVELNNQGRTLLLVEHSLPPELEGLVRSVDLTAYSSHTCVSSSVSKSVVNWHSTVENATDELLSLHSVQTAERHPSQIAYADLDLSSGGLAHVRGGIGSGKTTLLRILSGLLSCRGDVCLIGRPLKDYRRAELAGLMGVVLQSPEAQFFCASVEEEISFSAHRLGCFDGDLFEQLCRLLNLADYRERNPFTLSHGEQKKCQLASALMLKPRILLLDEPDAGMDLVSRNQLAQIFSAFSHAGGAILFTSHSPVFLGDLRTAGLHMIDYSVEGGSDEV